MAAPKKGTVCMLCGGSPAPLVVNGWWTCAACVYELEMGRRAKPCRANQRRRKHELMYPQEEHLFPLPQPQRRGR
jgi:hypothetical protein